VQNTGEPILTICMSYDVFLRKELPFGGSNDCTQSIFVKILSGVNFLNRDIFLNALTR